MIHSWLEAYNLVSDIIRVKNLVDEARLAGDKIIYRDDMEQQQLAGLVQYMRKVRGFTGGGLMIFRYNDYMVRLAHSMQLESTYGADVS